MRRRVVVTLAIVGLLALSVSPIRSHLHSTAFLLRFQGISEPGFVVNFGRHDVRTSPLSLGDGEHSIRALRFIPVGREDAPIVLLIHGLHPDGIDEPRLQNFAESMAAQGLEVIAPEMAGLKQFRIGVETIDQIGMLVRTLHQRRGRSVGIVGISFAGGLSLMAAADPHVGPHVAFVLSVGGHHQLSRVIDFLLSHPVRGPSGRTSEIEPHPYGTGILIHHFVDELFESSDREAARETLLALLSDRPADAQANSRALSPFSQAWMAPVLSGTHDDALAVRLASVVRDNRAQLDAVSPKGTLETLEVPVFIVHGFDDPIVPSIEGEWLTEEVPPSSLKGTAITKVLRHAEMAKSPSLREYWELVHLMASVLSAAEAG